MKKYLLKIYILLLFPTTTYAWEPNIQIGVAVEGPTIGYTIGTYLSDNILGRVIVDTETENININGRMQGQLLYYPVKEKMHYFFGSFGVHNDTTFFRGGIGKHWEYMHWRFHSSVGLNLKIEDDKGDQPNPSFNGLTDLQYLQIFGFGITYSIQ